MCCVSIPTQWATGRDLEEYLQLTENTANSAAALSGMVRPRHLYGETVDGKDKIY